MNEQASTDGPAQGWYTDPHNASRLRWWDGTAWTEHVHPPAGQEAAAQAPLAQQSAAGEQAAAAGAQPAAAGEQSAAAGQQSTAAGEQSAAAGQQQPAAAQSASAAAQPGAAATAATTPGIVTNQGPGAGGTTVGGAASPSERGALGRWLSVRSNVILLVVLVIAIVLFVLVMTGTLT